MKRARAFGPLVLLAALTGCGGTATVSGKVSYQGRPVLSGSVIVLNADGTARSNVILPDGTYVVEGVKKGPVRFGVFSPDPARARSILHGSTEPGANEKHGATKAKSPDWFPLPKALGDPATSGLACDVSSSRFHYNLEMK